MKTQFTIVAFIAAMALCMANTVVAQQWGGNVNINDPIYRNGNVGIGIGYASQKARLHVEATNRPTIMAAGDYGAQMSGSNYGHGVFGNNIFVDQNNQLRTSGTTSWTYGYSGMSVTSSNINFYAAKVMTTADAVITPVSRLFIRGSDGNVGIGTTNPTYKLSVNGGIRAKEVIVETNWSDYVFADGYKLRPLNEVEQFIKTNKHLPDVPTATEVEANGVSVGETQATLLRKVEELTLYMIELKKENQDLRSKLETITVIR